jgi:hypothetical protein
VQYDLRSNILTIFANGLKMYPDRKYVFSIETVYQNVRYSQVFNISGIPEPIVPVISVK